MKTFKDKDGRDWLLTVDVNANKRCKALCNVDLFSAIEGKLIGELLANPELLVNVIYAVCKPEADQAGLSDEQFGGRLVGDAIDAATTALLEDLVDFFPKARRGAIRQAMAKYRAIETDGFAQLSLAIEKMDPTAEIKKAFAEMQQGSGGSSTVLQDYPALTLRT